MQWVLKEAPVAGFSGDRRNHLGNLHCTLSTLVVVA